MQTKSKRKHRIKAVREVSGSIAPTADQAPATEPEVTNAITGGETTLTVTEIVHEVPQSTPLAMPVEAPAPAQAETPQISEATRAANAALLGIGLSTVSELAESFTKVPGIAFTPDERDAITEAWAPLMNVELSPAYMAAITTLIIVGGKVAKIVAYKRANKVNQAVIDTTSTATA